MAQAPPRSQRDGTGFRDASVDPSDPQLWARDRPDRLQEEAHWCSRRAGGQGRAAELAVGGGGRPGSDLTSWGVRSLQALRLSRKWAGPAVLPGGS